MQTTDELIEMIKNGKTPQVLKEIDYSGPSIHEYMMQILGEKQLTVKDVIDRLCLERSYGYQIFNGRRKPTRIILLRFALLMKMNLEQTQNLLKIGGKEGLYPRIRFDSALIYGLEHGYDFEQMEDLLSEMGEKSLF